MKISVNLFFLAPFVSFSVFSGENVGSHDNQPLLTSCQALATVPEHENAKSCIYFIRGFLAAAQAIDPPVINQQTKKNRKYYGLLSRPSLNKEQIPPARFFPFCVPDDESKARVIKIVSKHLPTQADTTKGLRDFVIKSLKAEYPCGQA